MHLKSYFLAFLFLLFSCSKSDDLVSDLEKKIEISIGNENFIIDGPMQISSNEDCSNLFVSAKYNAKNNIDEGFRIKFRITKKGLVKKIELYNYRESNKEYGSADFISNQIFTIKNFSFEKNTLYFEFEGDLILVDNNYNSLDDESPRKKIKGKVYYKNVINIACETIINEVNVKTNTFTFNSINSLGTYNPLLSTNPNQYNCFSNDGYRVSFKSDTKLWNLPIGQINFSETDIENRIDFDKYIGNIRATDALWIRPQDWSSFNSSGSFTIVEHVIEKGLKVTKGVFNVNLYENGNLLHEITNADFKIVDFE